MTPQQQIAEAAKKYEQQLVQNGLSQASAFAVACGYEKGMKDTLSNPSLMADRLEDILNWLSKENLIMSHGGLYQLVDKYIDHLNEKKDESRR